MRGAALKEGVLLQAKIDDLKQSLNTEFQLIHELCLFVLTASQKPDLIRATLTTLSAYLSWVPLGFILHSNIVEVLLKLFPQPHYRNVALQCLTEVRAFRLGEYDRLAEGERNLPLSPAGRILLPQRYKCVLCVVVL